MFLPTIYLDSLTPPSKSSADVLVPYVLFRLLESRGSLPYAVLACVVHGSCMSLRPWVRETWPPAGRSRQLQECGGPKSRPSATGEFPNAFSSLSCKGLSVIRVP